jgi:hypothetical protein
MAGQSRNGVLIAVVIFVVVAGVIKLFGGPLYKALLALHGKH